MSVLDSSAVFEYLLGRAPPEIRALLKDPSQPPPCAPSNLVFEIVSAMRRAEHRGELETRRAEAAVTDLGSMAVELFPTMGLREQAWALRHNFSAGDAMFVALAERLDEPLITTDRSLALAAKRIVGLRVAHFDVG